MNIAERENARLTRRLARIQLLSPLSLLVFIAASAIGVLVPRPSIRQISDDYLTIFTPSSQLIGLYWAVIALLLIGQSLVLALTRNRQTQNLLANGVGVRLPLVNLLMSLWVLFWSLKLFLAAEIVLFVVFALSLSLLGTTFVLYRSPKTTFLEAAFVYAPITMINVILFSVDIWQNGLLALKWYKYVGTDSSVHHGHWEEGHKVHEWGAFGIVLGTALVNAMLVFTYADIVWAASAVYLAVALTSVHHGKPPQVFVRFKRDLPFHRADGL